VVTGGQIGRLTSENREKLVIRSEAVRCGENYLYVFKAAPLRGTAARRQRRAWPWGGPPTEQCLKPVDLPGRARERGVPSR